MNVLVTGGCGFAGAVLVPRLLAEGHRVTVLDAAYFGTPLRAHPQLTVLVGDIRDRVPVTDAVRGQQAVIHLAAVSNDESVNASPAFSESVNVQALPALLSEAKRAGVERFIMASTSAVYGPASDFVVTEAHPLAPQWRYAKQKVEGERIALDPAWRRMAVTVVRPAALMGYSPRPRLDLTVNILTTHAVVNSVIEVWGGPQTRCSLHVEDMADAYLALLRMPKATIAGRIFNIGAENASVAELATIVQSVILPEPTIVVKDVPHLVSYRIDSTAFTNTTGWTPRRTVANAVADVADAFQRGLLPDPFGDDRYYNGRQMARLLAAR